jgi:ribosome maturation factor RimP
MLKADLDNVIKLVEPLIIDEGYELVDIEFKNESIGWVLRVYIDKEGGVNVDDCAALSREMSNLLDVEDISPNRYNLEVSSPGLNRPLRKREHFEKVIGERIKLRTRQPIEGARNFKAKLIEVSDSSILIDDDIKQTQIEFDNIEKANLIYNF